MSGTIKTMAAAGLAAMLLAGGAVQAQSQKPPAPTTQDPVDQLLTRPVKPGAEAAAPVNDGEAYHRADDSQQNPDEVRTTEALNEEIASRNQLAENQERADQEAFELERARYQATVEAATRERLAYEESVRQSDAAQRAWQDDVARSDAAHRQWEADVRACQAGDRTRCGPAN